jgi:hypothetical protein
MRFLYFLAIYVLVLVYIFTASARAVHVEGAERCIEFSPTCKWVARGIGGVLYLVGAATLYFQPPQTDLIRTFFMASAWIWLVALSFILNKRVVIVGRRVIDVSLTGRRRDLPISMPVRFDAAWFGEHLHLRANDVFLPGAWIGGGTRAAREARAAFRSLVLERTATPPSG